MISCVLQPYERSKFDDTICLQYQECGCSTKMASSTLTVSVYSPDLTGWIKIGLFDNMVRAIKLRELVSFDPETSLKFDLCIQDKNPEKCSCLAKCTKEIDQHLPKDICLIVEHFIGFRDLFACYKSQMRKLKRKDSL